MSIKEISLVEQNVLGTIYHNLDLLDLSYNEFFVTNIGNSIYKGLIALKDKGLEPSYRGLFLHSSKHYDSLKLDNLDFLKDNPNENYNPKNLSIYIGDLKNNKIVNELKNGKLDNLTIDLTKKSVDYDSIETKLLEMLNDVQNVKSGLVEDEVKFLSRLDETKEFEKIIEERKKGKTYSSGCSYLDNYLYNRSLMPEEMSIIFGLSGSGKSMYVRNLVERRLLKSLPTLTIELEMSLQSSLDTKMSIRTGLTRDNFSFHNEEDVEESHLDLKYEKVDKAIKTELVKSKLYDNYYQLNTDSLTIPELRKYIIQAKKLMGLKPLDYLFISIDLLTQMLEFNEGRGSTADNYTNALDNIHKLCKELKVHILGVVQPKRESSKVIVKSIQDVEKLRPNTEMLKNSSSIEERARVIISIFRPLHLLKKYCPDAPELEYAEDVLEARIIKQNNYELSPPMYYKFDKEKGALYSYPTYNPDLAFNIEEDEEDD